MHLSDTAHGVFEKGFSSTQIRAVGFCKAHAREARLIPQLGICAQSACAFEILYGGDSPADLGIIFIVGV